MFQNEYTNIFVTKEAEKSPLRWSIPLDWAVDQGLVYSKFDLSNPQFYWQRSPRGQDFCDVTSAVTAEGNMSQLFIVVLLCY